MGSFLDCREKNDFTDFEKLAEIKKRDKSLSPKNSKNNELKNEITYQKSDSGKKLSQTIKSYSSENNNIFFSESPVKNINLRNNLSSKGKKQQNIGIFKKLDNKLQLKVINENNKIQNKNFKQNSKKPQNKSLIQNSKKQNFKKSKTIFSSKVLKTTANSTKEKNEKNACLNNKKNNLKPTIKEIAKKLIYENVGNEDISVDFIKNNINNNFLFYKNHLEISDQNNLFSESCNENVLSKEFDFFFSDKKFNKSSNNYILTETSKDIIEKLKTIKKNFVTAHTERNLPTKFKSRKCPTFFNKNKKISKIPISIINSQIKNNIPLYRKKSANQYRKNTYNLSKLKYLSYFEDDFASLKRKTENGYCLGNYFLQDLSSFNGFNFNNSEINKSVNINTISQIKNKNTNFNTPLKKLLYRDLIQVDIIFKNTQICQDLIKNQKNNVITISYDILGKLNTKSILYDGYIYCVIQNKNEFMERYFQITKNCFRYYNDFYTALKGNEKPIVQFDIRHIKNDQIIGYKKLNKINKIAKNKNIKFAFIIMLNQNNDKFIIASDDKHFGYNIYNIIVLLKNYYEDKYR